jgi:peptide/nickel transport system substrate-binding protein
MLLSLLLISVGCRAPVTTGGGADPPNAVQPRTLVMAINTEVSNLSPKAALPTSPGRTTRIFNAGLTLPDAQLDEHPYLAEALPQLNSESWKVFPDGRMETTWRLRPGLTWHDGIALTADDFVFALRVYSAPGLSGVFISRPQNLIERMVAEDPRTIRIEWRSPYLHMGEGLEPLPRHLLAESFAAFEQDPAGHRDAFMGQRYWMSEYVGAGPFRLVAWEPATFFEGVAFDGHVLGKPKIDRIMIEIVNNENTVLAKVMAGQVHLSMGQAMRFEQAMVLRQQSGFNDVERKGVLLFYPASMNTLVFQHRPDYQQTPGLLDVRVRKAIVSAIDREGINERLFEGQSPVPFSFATPKASYFTAVDRAVTKYPLDVRRTEQLMAEAGFGKDRDGFFASASGQRFQPSFWNSADLQHQRTAAIVLDSVQRAGIDAQPFAMPNALERDQEARSTFPGALTHSIGAAETAVMSSMVSEQVSGPSNRWNGGNRGGWSNEAVDLLWERYNNTLSRTEQIDSFVQAMKVHSDHVPSLPLAYNLQVISHLAGLKGPEGETSSWNIHEWEWQ